MGIHPIALLSAVMDDVEEFTMGVNSPIHSEMSWKRFASNALVKDVVRKWIPSDAKAADQAAKDSFMLANSKCREWRPSEGSWKDSYLYGEIRKEIENFLHPNGEPMVGSYFDLLGHGEPGPGVNLGALGTSYYTKYFASPLTATSSFLYEEYKDYSEWFTFFSDAERQRYEKFGPPTIVSGSRCSLVPKTNATSRLICIEPTLNMFYQLGLAAHMERRLKSYFNIDLTTQPSVNHRLARKGSEDGTFCTIDLSSASDSISLSLCEKILPRWFFKLLLLLRSRTTLIDGKQVPLFMISTMGNGFTFPLQTMIFAAISKACTTLFGGRAKESKVFSVFGDDIIVHREIFEQVKYALELLGFTLNPSKTFSEGQFRESCGADWFCGQPVRSVFVKKLDLPYDYMVAVNQLNEWSAYTGIPLRGAVRLLMNYLDIKFTNYVPFDSNSDAGIRVPSILLECKKYDDNLSFVYKTWDRKPSTLRVLEGSIHTPGGFKGSIFYNPSGLYMSFLFGELRNLSISVRHDRPMLKLRRRCTPNWDHLPSDSETNGVKLSWRQWETAVAINLAKS